MTGGSPACRTCARLITAIWTATLGPGPGRATGQLQGPLVRHVRSEAPSLRDYLGEMAWYLDSFVDRREGGIEIVATHKWLMPCNWKFPAENFGGDAYHVQWNHLSAVKVAFSRGATANPTQRREDGLAGQRPCTDLYRSRTMSATRRCPQSRPMRRRLPPRFAGVSGRAPG